MASEEKFQYTYRMYTQGIRKIAREIKQTKVKFHYLVGVARGGVIPAVHLSHMLNLPIQIVHWSSFENRRMLVPDNHADVEIGEDLLNRKNILLVDDIIDGGTSIAELKSEWTSQRFFEFVAMQNLKIVSLVYNSNNKSGIKADFYHIEHPGKFVDFWWEK